MKRLCLLALFITQILCVTPIVLAKDKSPESVLYGLSGSGAIADIITAAEKSIDEFANANQIQKATWNNIGAGESTRVPEDCAHDYSEVVTSDTTYEYCETSHTIYIGQDFGQSLNRIYPMAAALGIAHEFGHHMQSLKGWSNAGLSPEDAADCVAGVWLAWFNKQHGSSLSLSDLFGITKLAFSVGQQSEYDTHGNSAERALAITVGYLGSLHSCNFYFPTI